LVAIPSVSADPAKRSDVRRCAEALVQRMHRAGLSRSEVLETAGNPIAYGEWLQATGRPTVLIYGHYDVQPVDPVELWNSPPFDATVRDGKVYGRGAVDDKGQVMMHVAALEAHLRTSGALPLNVKVVVEGEEEIGSPNFERFIAEDRERLACDAVVISDTAMFASDVPSLTVTLRGLVHWEVTVQGPASDLHSGYYGGVIRNPLEALAQMLASLKREDGTVAVAGFYDGVKDVDTAQRAELNRLPFEGSAEARALGVPSLEGEAGYAPLERMWLRPTLEINGMYGGYQGPGGKTIIPSFGRAKLSARLVEGQEPAHVRRVVREHFFAHAPSGVRVEISDEGDSRAVATARDHAIVQAAARAMERGFGKKPVFIGTGGTIGPVSSFDRVLNLPQVLIGVGLPDDAIHAPNEKFDLRQFFLGIETMTYLYEELAVEAPVSRT
ncbi:MAG: dipeptidase, partial [Candidatus Eremiobacteraeota bacterium]|nr:dipeptidase [Candidatus Eremiobacteraeota bacterium]